MARINLLPWRENLRKERQREFGMMALAAVLVSAAVCGGVYLFVDGMITYQEQRNAYLKSEIAVVDRQIKEIKDLERTKANLIARMNVIQELQSSRPESVHLLDELVRTLPEGVFLKSFTQRGKGLSMVGVAQSNARVSDYMRNIDSSEWFTDPRLDLIKTTEANRRRIANFTLRGSQKARIPEHLDDAAGEVTP